MGLHKQLVYYKVNDETLQILEGCIIYLFGFDIAEERLLKNSICSMSGIYLEEILPNVTHIIPHSYTI